LLYGPFIQVISQCSERPVPLDFSEFDEETVFAFLECIYTGSTSLLKEETLRQNLADIAERCVHNIMIYNYISIMTNITKCHDM